MDLVALPQEEKDVLANFQYQVANGGLDQYIFNGYGKREITDLIFVLKKIGAEETRKKLDNVTFYVNTDECECEYCENNRECFNKYGNCITEAEVDEDNEIYCECECIWKPIVEEKDIYEIEDDSFDSLSGWDDHEFYESSDYKMIDKILDDNDGKISQNNSIVLDTLLSSPNN